ncbi:MAG TPA: hypothetical protein VMT52_07980 [Planctomycetota bacterium]|nr:hypothetical protein [Planctomycetota bacterium]
MPEEPEKPEFDGIEGGRLSRLLRLGLSGEREPVDELISRLDAPDGRAWLEAVVDRGPLALEPSRPLADLLAEGKAPLEVMLLLKKRANALLGRLEPKEDFLCGIAGYFFTVAAALVHHGTMISSQDEERLEAVFRKLSHSVPEPWKSLLRRALEAPRRPRGPSAPRGPDPGRKRA